MRSPILISDMAQYRSWPSFMVAAAFAALLIGLAVVNRVNAAHAETSAQSVAHTYAVTAELAEMLSTLVDAETGQRGFVITGEVAISNRITRRAPRCTRTSSGWPR